MDIPKNDVAVQKMTADISQHDPDKRVDKKTDHIADHASYDPDKRVDKRSSD